jgi:hypothetical protein
LAALSFQIAACAGVASSIAAPSATMPPRVALAVCCTSFFIMSGLLSVAFACLADVVLVGFDCIPDLLFARIVVSSAITIATAYAKKYAIPPPAGALRQS